MSRRSSPAFAIGGVPDGDVGGPVRALCNSCLRVRHFADFCAQERELCDCGDGPEIYCSCGSCCYTIAQLEGGERIGAALDLKTPGHIGDWSAAEGLARAS